MAGAREITAKAMVEMAAARLAHRGFTVAINPTDTAVPVGHKAQVATVGKAVTSGDTVEDALATLALRGWAARAAAKAPAAEAAAVVVAATTEAEEVVPDRMQRAGSVVAEAAAVVRHSSSQARRTSRVSWGKRLPETV